MERGQAGNKSEETAGQRGFVQAEAILMKFFGLRFKERAKDKQLPPGCLPHSGSAPATHFETSIHISLFLALSRLRDLVVTGQGGLGHRGNEA